MRTALFNYMQTIGSSICRANFPTVPPYLFYKTDMLVGSTIGQLRLASFKKSSMPRFQVRYLPKFHFPHTAPRVDRVPLFQRQRDLIKSFYVRSSSSTTTIRRIISYSFLVKCFAKSIWRYGILIHQR